MNDPVVPVASPPGLPPSYLRPPQSFRAGRDMSKTLLLWTGIAAIILILCGFIVAMKGGGLGGIFSKDKIKGELVVFGSLPARGAYVHTFGIDYFAPIHPIEGDSQLIAAALDPSHSRLAELSIKADVQTMIIRSLIGEEDVTLYTGKKGERLSTPVWSIDGMSIAFVSLPDPVVDPESGAVRITANSYQLRVFSISGIKEATLKVQGTPLGFSWDKSSILLLDNKSLSIVDMKGGVHSTNAPELLPNRGVVKVSEDGTMVAIIDETGVEIFTIDWGRASLTSISEIKGSYTDLVWSQKGNLLLFDGATVAAYRLSDGRVTPYEPVAMTPEAPIRLLSWIQL